MVKFLDTAQTSEKLIEMFEDAERFITIISPYIQINKKIKKILERKKANITLVFGKDLVKDSEMIFLLGCDNTTVRYLHNLHAKCYLTDKGVIISSMNLYKYSEKNNFEMSVYIDKDAFAYKEIYNHVKTILRESEMLSESKYLKKL